MLAKGASILNEKDGGGAIFESFVHPTVLYPVNKEMKIYHEEQFGPIIPIVPFESLAEPIEYVADSPYGQQVLIEKYVPKVFWLLRSNGF